MRGLAAVLLVLALAACSDVGSTQWQSWRHNAGRIEDRRDNRQRAERHHLGSSITIAVYHVANNRLSASSAPRCWRRLAFDGISAAGTEAQP
jgi:hypothetical protein